MIVSQCKARVKGVLAKKSKGIDRIGCSRRCAHTNRSSPANRAQRKPPKGERSDREGAGRKRRAKPYKTVVL